MEGIDEFIKIVANVDTVVFIIPGKCITKVIIKLWHYLL
jgi:hypothetical protein